MVTIPGVQKPHCRASRRTKFRWSGLSPSAGVRPSTVTTSRPAASTARIMQAFTGSPSRRTVQAPQAPRSQTRFGPVT